MIHSETEWSTRLAEVGAAIDTATPDEQIALISSLVGLLDTHSAFVDIPGGRYFYGLLPYRFSDGWYIVRARDESLVGSRLEAINGIPIEDVVQRLTPLAPHDNANGLLESVIWLLSTVGSCTGLGS